MVTFRNPIVSCDSNSIPRLDLSHWRESSTASGSSPYYNRNQQIQSRPWTTFYSPPLSPTSLLSSAVFPSSSPNAQVFGGGNFFSQQFGRSLPQSSNQQSSQLQLGPSPQSSFGQPAHRPSSINAPTPRPSSHPPATPRSQVHGTSHSFSYSTIRPAYGRAAFQSFTSHPSAHPPIGGGGASFNSPSAFSSSPSQAQQSSSFGRSPGAPFDADRIRNGRQWSSSLQVFDSINAF